MQVNREEWTIQSTRDSSDLQLSYISVSVVQQYQERNMKGICEPSMRSISQTLENTMSTRFRP